MVELFEIQAAYYMVAATGVLVAAVFYVLNLRISQRNQKLMLKAQQQTLETRRMGMVENMMRTLTDYEGSKHWMEIMNYEWTDYADFERKYGSDNNEDAAAKRYATWHNFNAMGMMLRNGMMGAEDIYDLGGNYILFQWAKWKPIVEEVRRRYWGQDYLRDFEYLNDEMLKVKMRRDPSYRVPETLGKFISDR